jgi:ribonuclease HI
MSAKMSISINGKQHGFFSCTRGVRQGDPLSPLLFCLAEEVISRSITKLVRDGKLSLIKGSRNMDVPSHILYADDIMLFCKASRSNIQSLSNLFMKYAESSGQFVNPRKSFIYAGAIPSQRLHHIANRLGFNIGVLPFVYLGAPIFKGKPKKCHLQPIADKIKAKLSSWKAYFLSMAGRMQLIKSVIQGMMMYSISVYSWPSSLIKDLEKWIRNFLWSGDVNKRKLVTVAWHKVCTPFHEGGLGIRSLSKVNEAANLKTCWELFQSEMQWAKFLRSRIFKGSFPISYHISSSVWSSVRHKFHDICSNSSWQVGNGELINFWLDPWCGEPLVLALNIPQHLHPLLKAKVTHFIENRSWKIPACLLLAYPALQSLTDSTTIPLIEKEDKLFWKHSHDGDLTMKDSYSFHCPASQLLSWTKIIWNVSIPPSKSMVVWRSLQHKLPTDASLALRGCHLPSMCSLCETEMESNEHLFLTCRYAQNIWNWLGSRLNVNCQFNELVEAFKLCNSRWSPLCNLVVGAAIVNCVHFIWYARNQARFNDRKIHWKSIINLIIAAVSMSGNNSCLKAFSNIPEFTLLQKFHVKLKFGNAPRIKEVIWQPPIFNWIKCNCDGASLGNTGFSACGGIFRNADSSFLGVYALNIGVSTSLKAELIGAMIAIETATNKGWSNMWLESDSMLVVLAFSSARIVPWSLRNRWDNCLLLISNMNFYVSHIYREGNHCADKLANLGLSLPTFTWWDHIPHVLLDDFGRNRLGMPYFRFC